MFGIFYFAFFCTFGLISAEFIFIRQQLQTGFSMVIPYFWLINFYLCAYRDTCYEKL